VCTSSSYNIILIIVDWHSALDKQGKWVFQSETEGQCYKHFTHDCGKINYDVHYINTNVHFAGFHASLFRWANMFYNIDTKGLYHKTFYGCNL
jgi:hypothetical protein